MSCFYFLFLLCLSTIKQNRSAWKYLLVIFEQFLVNATEAIFVHIDLILEAEKNSMRTCPPFLLQLFGYNLG